MYLVVDLEFEMHKLKFKEIEIYNPNNITKFKFIEFIN